MRVVVTGATGFVGRRLVRALAERGDTVVGISRDPERARRNIAALTACFVADDPRAYEGCDAVVHLAGEPVGGRWTADKQRRIENSRVEGTRALVRCFARADPKPKALIAASAMGYYGDRGEETIDENEPPGDDFLARVCVGWEREAARANEHGVRVTHARIGLVLGRDGGPLPEMLPMFRRGLGGRLGSGSQWWSWIAVEDLVGLFLAMIDRPAMTGPYNAVAPQPVRQRDFAATLARALDRPAFVPAPAFALQALLGRFARELLASRRLIPARALAEGVDFAHPDLDAILRKIVSRV